MARNGTWRVGGGWLVGTVAACSILACGDSLNPDPNGQECPGSRNFRLHVVNISDVSGLTVTASYAGMTCGPYNIPVSTDQGLELAQLLIEGAVGDVISVQVTGPGGPATVSCRVTNAATGFEGGGLQAFVNVVVAPPVSADCAGGLELVAG